MSRLLVCGSRHWHEPALIRRIVDRLPPETVIVHGDSGNADRWAAQFAEKRGLEVDPHPADWARYSKAAGPIRNAEMIKVSELVVAFWDGLSPDTRDTLRQARDAGLTIYIFYSTPTARIVGRRRERLAAR